MNIGRLSTARSASVRNATRSRRERSSQPLQPRWFRPFVTLQQTLTATMYKILSCQSATRPEYSTLRGRMRAFRRLDVAYGRLMSATDKLERATAALRAMIDAVTAEPERAGNAPAEVALAAHEIFVLSARVAKMTLALDATAALLEDCRQVVGKPRPIPDWLYSRYPIDPRERILLLLDLLRRRRSRCRAIEDVPRRISRGRAPPFDPTCSL